MNRAALVSALNKSLNSGSTGSIYRAPTGLQLLQLSQQQSLPVQEFE
jgi:hypothetical protein